MIEKGPKLKNYFMNKKFALKINNISKAFEEKVVLKDVSFSLYLGQKVALIGNNGSGKSTLAKIIIGREKADEGSVEVFKNFPVAYLPQEIKEDVLISQYLEKSSGAFALLKDLGLSEGMVEEIFRRKISSLSGGEKTKVFLAKIALEKTPIIILDEPTNNLDIRGLEFLEKIIKESPSAFLIISHDRKFLDNTVSRVIHLDEFSHELKSYDGNYSDFLKVRTAEIERANLLYVESQKRKKKIEMEIRRQKEKSQRIIKKDIIMDDKNKVSANRRIEGIQSSAGKNLKRAKDKIEHFQEKEKPFQKRPLKIDFSQMKKSGQKVLFLKNLLLPYGSKKKISLELFAGDRLIIAGPNGTGKTTLIKTLLKSYADVCVNSGMNSEMEWGANIELGYLPQDLSFQKEYKNILE